MTNVARRVPGLVTATSPTFAKATQQPLAEGDVLLWRLGGAGFLLRSAEGSLLVDPYLTTEGWRRFPPPFPADEAAAVDAVLITHEHRDHLDVDVVKAFVEAGSAAHWVVPAPIAGRLAELGVPEERIVPAQPGQLHEFGGIEVQPVASVHGVDMADAYNTGEAISDGKVRYLGYVMDVAGTRIYHSGDCLAYPGQADELARLAVDVVLLPINGRDADREAINIVGNMTSEEAVTLAVASGAEMFVPMHWDLFPDNLGYPGEAVAIADRDHPGLTVLVLSRDRPFALHRVGRHWAR